MTADGWGQKKAFEYCADTCILIVFCFSESTLHVLIESEKKKAAIMHPIFIHTFFAN